MDPELVTFMRWSSLSSISMRMCDYHGQRRHVSTVQTTYLFKTRSEWMSERTCGIPSTCLRYGLSNMA